MLDEGIFSLHNTSPKEMKRKLFSFSVLPNWFLLQNILHNVYKTGLRKISKQGHKVKVAPWYPVFGLKTLGSNPCPVIYKWWKGKEMTYKEGDVWGRTWDTVGISWVFIVKITFILCALKISFSSHNVPEWKKHYLLLYNLINIIFRIILYLS